MSSAVRRYGRTTPAPPESSSVSRSETIAEMATGMLLASYASTPKARQTTTRGSYVALPGGPGLGSSGVGVIGCLVFIDASMVRGRHSLSC